MSKRSLANIHRPGGFVVKAAESRRAKASGRVNESTTVPTDRDRSLARALLKAKRESPPPPARPA